MKIRKNELILFLFIIFQIGKITAQESRFKEDETLNVWAASGLNMRDKPDAKAAKVATIPYGAKVSVQPNIGVKIPFEIEEFKGFTVKGYWLLVKYGDTEGFVFDGFLSRLPAPNLNDKEGMEAYFDKKIGKIGEKFEVRFYDETVDSMRYARPNEKYDLDKHDEKRYKQKYKASILLENVDSEGGGGYKIILPNSTVYEGYFLVKTFYYDQKTDIFSFNKKEKKVNMTVREEGAGCYYDIKQEGTKIIIDGGCGC